MPRIVSSGDDTVVEGTGFVITASLSASTVLFISELLAEGVVPIPLDGSTVVEGTVCTTAVSSPVDEVRSILAARLRKAKTQIKTCKSTIRKYSIANITSYSPVASSFGGAATLPRHLPSTPQALGLGITLGVGLCSPSLLSPDAASSAQSSLDISIVYMKLHMSILRFD